MKKYAYMFKAAALLALVKTAMIAAPLSSAEPSLKVGLVNFKSCVENSKIGKQEQANFDGLKKQAEMTMQQREREINELAGKLQDADYVDSLSKEAEADLKYKYKTMSQEVMQQQQQLYQTLSQANFKIIQKLTEDVNQAAKIVAEKNGYDMIMNDEAFFYFGKKLDISPLVVAELDATFDAKPETKR